MTHNTALAHADPDVELLVPAEMPTSTPLTPMAMISRAIESGLSTDMIDKLMDLQERHERNLGRKAFDNAIAAAKAEIPTIGKNREVDFTSQKGRTNYKYEDLAGIAKVIDPILSAHGLSYRYKTSQEGDQVQVTCVLSHREGYSEETSLSASRDNSGNKNSIQAVSSTITYLQRYTLKAALGLAAGQDDDGQGSERDEDREPLDPARVAHIRKELEALGVEEAAFCEYLKVDNLMEMPTGRFSDACSALSSKRRKIEQEKAAEQSEASA
jgi:hypothetical protein